MKRNVASNIVFENLDFEMILWRQIARIGAASESFENWKANIITLEALLYPYSDELSRRNTKQLRQDENDEIELYRKIMEELLMLMKRNNLLLTKKGDEMLERFDDE